MDKEKFLKFLYDKRFSEKGEVRSWIGIPYLIKITQRGDFDLTLDEKDLKNMLYEQEFG